ncbi:MAG TPA: hypothetical protein VLE53_10155 [Gemmatimonadaceae bacterium]|nr:hypothetical protein [Gemmatimonadaceae bacterium]
MQSVFRRIALPVALVATAVFAACGGNDDNSALEQDSALARDLARAGVDSAAQPELKDIPAAEPAPATKAPTTSGTRTPAPRPKTSPTPPPPAEPPAPTRSGDNTVTKSEPGSEPALGAIPAGTALALTSAQKVCTNTNKVGDRFTATTDAAVTGSNGAVIPAGSRVVIEITELHRSENANDKIVMGFRVVSLTAGDKTYYPEAEVVSAEIDRVRASSTANDAKKVLGGAVAGAIIGQVIGRDRKGTLIGAAAGAAAGAGAAAATADFDGCVEMGSAISVKLTTALTVAAVE